MRGARRRRRRGEYRSTLQLLSDYIEALEGAEVPTEDARWGAAWVARSRTYLNDDNPKEARRWAERAREAADRHGWEVIESQAMGWLGLAKQWLGEQDALETLEGAFRLLEEVATEGRMRGAYGSVAHGLTSLREFEKAERLLELDHREAQRHSDERAVANNFNLRCRLAFFRQDFDAALEYAKRALSLFTGVGHLPGAATCQETMAEIQRRKGNLQRAETIYHKCIELQEAIGFRQAIAQMNLASLLLNRGEVDEAEKRFVLAASAFDESGRRSFHAVAVAGLLACASCQGWWNSIEEHLETIRAFVEKTDECERDLAEHLERAGDDLTEAERYEYAYEAYDLAYTQWERIGDEERIEAVAAKLAKWV
jgi:tetratricopeptide (TPR) repeat protein